MLCRVEMPSNEQIFGRFYRYRLFRMGGGPNAAGGGGRALMIIMPVLALLLLLFAWGSGMSLLLPLIICAAILGYYVFLLWIKPSQLFRKKSGAALNTEITIFTDTGFTRTVRSEEGGHPETLSTQYSGLVMAVETGNDFYLFTSPAQAYLFDKSYFTKGSPEELREALQKKLGAKFKGKK